MQNLADHCRVNISPVPASLSFVNVVIEDKNDGTRSEGVSK